MDFLERLRKKPSHVRSRIAFGTALSITAIIGLIWSTTITARFSGMEGVLNTEEIEQAGAISDSFTEFFERTSGERNESTDTMRGDTESDDIVANALNDLRAAEGGAYDAGSSTTTPESLSKTEQKLPSEEKIILIGTSTKSAQ